MTMRNKDQELSKYGRITYNLRTILDERSIDVAELSRITGMNPVIIKRAMLGETQPSFEQMARICCELKITPNDLLEYVPPTA